MTRSQVRKTWRRSLTSGLSMLITWGFTVHTSVQLSHGFDTSSQDTTLGAIATNAGTSGTLPTPGMRERLAELDRNIDPNRDGWLTEAFSDAAEHQLKIIGMLLAGPEPIQASNLAGVATRQYVGGPIRPDRMEEVFRDKALRVERAPRKSSSRSGSDYPPPSLTSKINARGREGLGQALRAPDGRLGLAASPAYEKHKNSQPTGLLRFLCTKNARNHQ